jgi:hypothetical protein
MKHFGNIDLNNNLMQQMVMELETNFPDSPVAGRIIFKDKRVYMCVEILNGLPVWVPLTNELNTYVHRQTGQSNTWNINHNLNTTTPMIQIYDVNHLYVIPNAVAIVDNNNLNVTFGYPIIGSAVLMFGEAITGSSRTSTAYTSTQTAPSSAWVIIHELGYFPVVRVFIGNVEVQPDSITHNSIFQLTINFSSPQVGVARLV